MAYQSQTYGNSNSGYYIQGSTTINPSSVTALLSPVEFLYNSTIQGPYFGALSQELSTFTISENETVGLSTINALIMNPASKVTQMFVRDKTDVADQPIIQQWTPASTIVNGIFKAGNQNLNDEANAYYIQNTSQVTFQGQGALEQRTSLASNTTRFGNANSNALIFTEIDQNNAQANIKVRNGILLSETRMTPSTFVINALDIGGNALTNTKLSNDAGAPFNTVLSGNSNVDIRTDFNATNLTPASFKTDGTVSFLSTITAPTVSSIVTNSNISNTNAANLSTIAFSGASNAAIRINASGSTDMFGLLTVPSISTLSLASNFASIPDLSGVSTINAVPIIDYLIGNPVGTIISWASLDLNLIPPGYLLCDGSYVSQSTYPKLFIIIGNAWGGSPPPGFFRLPDCRGKILAGSMTINSPTPGISNGTPYTVNGTCTALDTVTLPAYLGGGTRVCLRVSNLDNQLYIGMRVLTPGFNNFTQITFFIDSDGMYGNEYPQGSQPARVNLIMFDSNQTNTNTLPITITFTNENTDVRLYPFVGQQWVTNQTIRTGIGAHFIVNNSFQTSNHTHVWGQGGAQGQSGLGPRCGDPNNPLDTSGTNTLFTYPNRNPAVGGTVNGPSAVDIMPYNIATWQLIKY